MINKVLKFLNTTENYSLNSIIEMLGYIIDNSRYKNEKSIMLNIVSSNPIILTQIIPKIKEKLISEFKVNWIVGKKGIYYYV